MLKVLRVGETTVAPLEALGAVDADVPDIVLVDIASPGPAVLERLAAMAGAAPRPIVAFSLRVALEWLEARRRLGAELEETRARLEERKLVDRAKGILMKQRNTSEDEAFALLRSLAMQRGIRLGEAARQVIDVARMLG